MNLFSIFAIAALAMTPAYAHGGPPPRHVPQPDLVFQDHGRVTLQLVLNAFIEEPAEQQGQPAPGVGTTAYLMSELSHNGQAIGSNRGMCVSLNMADRVDASDPTEPEGQIQKCEQALTLRGRGQIHMSALFNRSTFDEEGEVTEAAIVGGTREFSRARGQACVIRGATRVDHTYKIFLNGLPPGITCQDVK